MGNRCVGGGDGRRECVVQRRAVAAVRGGVACRFLEWSVFRLSSQLALRYTLATNGAKRTRERLGRAWLLFGWCSAGGTGKGKWKRGDAGVGREMRGRESS
jgi:hypothetical protein